MKTVDMSKELSMLTTEIEYSTEELYTLKKLMKKIDRSLLGMNVASFIAAFAGIYRQTYHPECCDINEMIMEIMPIITLLYTYHIYEHSDELKNVEDRIQTLEEKRDKEIRFIGKKAFIEPYMDILQKYEFADIITMERNKYCAPELTWNMFVALLMDMPDQNDEFMSGATFDEIPSRSLVEEEMLYTLTDGDLLRLMKAVNTAEDRQMQKRRK